MLLDSSWITLSLIDLNISVSSADLVNFPFTDPQHLQLRAQIFAYGALMWVIILLCYWINGTSRYNILCPNANKDHRYFLGWNILFRRMFYWRDQGFLLERQVYNVLLERSRVLIKKAGVLRSSGMENISSCLESLSKAISLLVVGLNHLMQFLMYPEKNIYN
jgi:hypothetical protein